MLAEPGAVLWQVTSQHVPFLVAPIVVDFTPANINSGALVKGGLAEVKSAAAVLLDAEARRHQLSELLKPTAVFPEEGLGAAPLEKRSTRGT